MLNRTLVLTNPNHKADMIPNKKSRTLYLILFILTGSTKGHSIPPYNGTGPQNVYYLTGVGNNLFSEDRDTVWSNQDDWSKPYRALRDAYIKQGYNFYASLPKNYISSSGKVEEECKKNVCVIFCHNTPNIPWCNQVGNMIEKMVILALEPPHIWPVNYDPTTTKYFRKILTWHDLMVDNKQFFKYFYVQAHLELTDKLVPFSSKKLCTFIGGNKGFSHPNELYSKRREAVDFFEKHAPNDFDFYGQGWNPKTYKTYKGPVKSKTDTLRRYKFSICYENIADQPGYITEKIFGSFIAGCIPIYWGANNITDYIPDNCFIDKRKFTNLKDLYTFISTMQEPQYNQYLNNIRTFLQSENAQKFSVKNFVETVTRVAHNY